MKLRKGLKLQFPSRKGLANEIETIEKASNDRYNGMVKTDSQEYSTDFIWRWIDFGFVEVLDKNGNKIEK